LECKPTKAGAKTTDGHETDANPVETTLPAGRSVVGYPVHHESEEVALAFLKRLASLDGEFQLLSTKLLPSQVLSQLSECNPDTVVLSVLPPGGLSQLQFMCSEIRIACPTTKIVVAHFGTIKNYDRVLVRMRKIGVTYLTTSVSQTSQLLTVISQQKLDERHKVDLGSSAIVPSPHSEGCSTLQSKTSSRDEVTRVR